MGRLVASMGLGNHVNLHGFLVVDGFFDYTGAAVGIESAAAGCDCMYEGLKSRSRLLLYNLYLMNQRSRASIWA